MSKMKNSTKSNKYISAAKTVANSYRRNLFEDIKVMLKTSELNKVKYDIKLVKKKNVKDNEKVGILKVYIGKEYVGKTNIYIISKENKEKSIKQFLML